MTPGFSSEAIIRRILFCNLNRQNTKIRKKWGNHIYPHQAITDESEFLCPHPTHFDESPFLKLKALLANSRPNPNNHGVGPW